MTHTCPYPPCGQELEDDHRHIGHEAMAADKVNVYIRRRQADGSYDVYRVPKEKEAEARSRFHAWDRAVERRRRRQEEGLTFEEALKKHPEWYREEEAL